MRKGRKRRRFSGDAQLLDEEEGGEIASIAAKKGRVRLKEGGEKDEKRETR